MSKKYLLSGLTVCNKCGANMIGKTRKVNGKEYHYYVCNNYNTKGKNVCNQKGMQASDLEEKVIEILIERFKHLLIMASAKQYIEVIDAEIDELKSEVKKLEDSLSEFNKFQKNRYNRAFTQLITEIKHNLINFIDNLQNLEDKKQFFSTYKYKDNITKELINDSETLKENIRLFIKEVLFYDNEIQVVFYN